MNDELITAKADSQHFLDALLEQKGKQAESMDQVQVMHNALIDEKRSLDLERKRFEE